MYRELIGKLIEGHDWAKIQEPCPENEISTISDLIIKYYNDEV